MLKQVYNANLDADEKNLPSIFMCERRRYASDTKPKTESQTPCQAEKFPRDDNKKICTLRMIRTYTRLLIRDSVRNGNNSTKATQFDVTRFAMRKMYKSSE